MCCAVRINFWCLCCTACAVIIVCRIAAGTIRFSLRMLLRCTNTYQLLLFSLQLIARRKALIEHVSAMDASDYVAERNNNLKFGASFMSHGVGSSAGVSAGGSIAHSHTHHPLRSRGRATNGSVSSVLSQSVTSLGIGPSLSRANTQGRSASMDAFAAAHAAAAAVSAASNVFPNNSGGAGTSSPNPTEERRRSKSLTPAARSKSLAQINDISQIVGAAGMAAIFNAAGLIPTPIEIQQAVSSKENSGTGARRAHSIIFQHTAVETVEEGDTSAPGWPTTSSAAAGAAKAIFDSHGDAEAFTTYEHAHSMPSLPVLHGAAADGHNTAAAQTMSALPQVVGSVTRGQSGRHRAGSFAEQSEAARIENRNAFTAMLGFDVSAPVSGGSSPVVSGKHQSKTQQQRPRSGNYNNQGEGAAGDVHWCATPPGPSPGPHASYAGDGIAYKAAISPEQINSHMADTHDGYHQQQAHRQVQRPFTANAALRHAPSMAEQLEQEARQREREAHEAHKAAQKELLRARTRQEKHRLGRTTDNEFGLPRDVFRNNQTDVSAVIGLKFLRAVSKNPGIYEDVKLKKRPASSTGRSHGQRW
jgi:hypothetical protein